MTPAHRVETILTEDGKLALDNLPFRAGLTVEVIVLATARAETPAEHPLRGMVLRFDDPAAPVAEADWGVLQ